MKGKKIKNRMNFNPNEGLEGLFGHKIEGHYTEIQSGDVNGGNSNNAIYKVITKNKDKKEVPYFVKFVGNNPDLKRFKDKNRVYILRDLEYHPQLKHYLDNAKEYLEQYRKNNEIESTKYIRNFIHQGIQDGFFKITTDNKIMYNNDCNKKILLKTVNNGIALDLLVPYILDQGIRASSENYKDNNFTPKDMKNGNTMAYAHWQNMLAQIFDEKNPWKFSHNETNYEVTFTPIRKITTNNGKIFITKGTEKTVSNMKYNYEVSQLDQETSHGDTIKAKTLDPAKIFLMCGINDMHCGNVGSTYDDKTKTWKIDAFDIQHQHNIIAIIKYYNKNNKFNQSLKSFYSHLFSKESIEKICNYLKNKNMKHETKSYMNDVLNELSSIKEFLEQKKIITKNGIQFPKKLR